MHAMLNTAIKAARRGGDLILRYLDRLDGLQVVEKGPNDFVTRVDRETEQEIVATILSTYPDHGILAEETGAKTGNDYQWIIDPLDGTTNFLHGHPQFSVSIALAHRGALQQAVVFDPLRNELFSATRGRGAKLNDRRIRVSAVSRLRATLLGTGFPFKDPSRLDYYLRTLRVLLRHSSGVRRAGSAALDLAYVACGRFDGFWEFGLKPWDMAAGCLLIEEAGGLVSEPNGGQEFLNSGDVVAGNPEIHEQILARLADIRQDR